MARQHHAEPTTASLEAGLNLALHIAAGCHAAIQDHQIILAGRAANRSQSPTLREIGLALPCKSGIARHALPISARPNLIGRRCHRLGWWCTRRAGRNTQNSPQSESPSSCSVHHGPLTQRLKAASFAMPLGHVNRQRGFKRAPMGLGLTMSQMKRQTLSLPISSFHQDWAGRKRQGLPQILELPTKGSALFHQR